MCVLYITILSTCVTYIYHENKKKKREENNKKVKNRFLY